MFFDRRRLSCFAFAIGLVGVGSAVALGVTPIPAGLVSGEVVLINGKAGDQTDPHLSGDLAAYTDTSGGSFIRYYDFATNLDTRIDPQGSFADLLPDVSGTRISFSRQLHNRLTAMVYDTATGVLTEIGAPTPGVFRLGTAIGGTTVAFVETTSNLGDVFVADLSSAAAPLNVSAAWPDKEQSPAVAPSGSVVVWERRGSTTQFDIVKATRTGGVWSPPEVVADSIDDDMNPDTDGTWVVYDSLRTGSTTGQDIFFRNLVGGPEMRLEMAGDQRNPSIKRGVISFEHTEPGETISDLRIYVIAYNLFFQVTATPDRGEHLSDIDILADDRVRMVWAMDTDGTGAEHNIVGSTFQLPLPLPPLSSQPPTLTKTFAPSTIYLGSNSTLTFTLANPNTTMLTGVGFTDPLPQPGLIVATPNGLTSSCGGSVTAVPGSTSITLTGGTLADSAACSFSLAVTGNWVGAFTNTTGNVTSTESGSGGAASASITVQTLQPPNCHGSMTSGLAKLYNGLKNAAVILGYPNVPALQDAIRASCGQ
jgi:hypothetical protein